MTSSRIATALIAGLGTLLLGASAARAGDYQIYKDGVCFPNSQCGIDFANVPAGKTVTLSNFSCYVRYPSNNSLGAVQLVLVRNSDGSRAFALTAGVSYPNTSVNVGTGTNSLVVMTNDTIKAVGHFGQHFKTYVQVQKDSDGSVGTVSQFSCSISGTIN